jgi:ATP/maltotriose-dependent transcriptional regulator MalT
VPLTSGDSLIGRDRELEQLRGLVRAVRDGAAVTVLIEGEAGIGKTRLLASLLDAAREQCVTVFHGAAHPLEHTRPFGPLIDALDLRPGSSDPRRAAIGRLLTGQDAPPPGSGPAAGQLQFRAVEDIIDLIELLTDQGPVLLALDDLHWAESSTLLAVRWIMRRLTAAPLLLAATLRPSPQSPDLAQLLDDATQLRSDRIELKPLGDEQVEALVRAELGVPAGETLTGVVGRAAGNPLWVMELLRALATEGLLDLTGPRAEVLSGDLPDSIRQLVALPERTVAALRTASLLGEAFSLTDMAAVTGRRVIDLVDDLGPAFEARLVADHRGVLVFRHQLVRDAIYEQIPEAARVALHREAAQALADTGAPLSKVASHLVLGAVAPDPEAAHSLRLAAEEAAPRAPGVAVELLHRAEELLPPDDPGRDAVLATLVENLLRIGQISRGAAIAEEVLGRPHAAEIDQPLRFTLIDALSILNRGPQLIEQTEAAIRESPRMPLSAKAFLLAQSSFGRAFSGDLTGAEAASLQALEYAERSEDVAMITWSLTTLSLAVKTQGRYQEGVAATDRVRELAFESPDPQARMRGPFFMSGMALCDADRLDEAAQAFRRAAEECRALETWWLLPDINLAAAEVRLLRGDW